MQARMQFLFFGLLNCISLFAISEAYAYFPLPPRFSANAYASDYTVGQTDLLVPMAGNYSHAIYIDPNLAYGSDNQGYADLGVGYRVIHNDTAILGIYLFGGYSRIANNAHLWVANPGVEALGSRWDAHLNGYFVGGKRNYTVGTFTGTQLGLNTLHFSGHTLYDELFQINQYAGPGADASVAYQLFSRSSLKGYLGSYFFAPSHTSNVWGAATGLEYWLHQNIKIFAGYTYDNLRHSTGALGLGVEFGGLHVHRSDPALEERLTDPVTRYLGELGRGSAIPSRTKTQGIPGVEGAALVTPLLTDIAFFSQNGTPNNGGVGLTLANCTYANPCGPLDFTALGVSTLNGLLPGTAMYFSSGSYPATADASGMAPLPLQPGQSVNSRTADYLRPAIGNARAVFHGAFVMADNTTLNNVILLPTPPLNSDIAMGEGILADDVVNFSIIGSQIGSPQQPFLRGVFLAAAGSTGIIDSSDIFSSYKTISIIGPADLTIQNSTINANGTEVFGILENGTDAVVTLTDSQVNVVGTSVAGLQAQNPGGVIVANNTTVTATSSALAVALDTEGDGAIQVNGGILTVNGDINSGITNEGDNIEISSSTLCVLNGEEISCS
jgi:hypothetical protein